MNGEISWSNIIGFEFDSTNDMIDEHNSVLSHIKLKQADVFSSARVMCAIFLICLYLLWLKENSIHMYRFFKQIFM